MDKIQARYGWTDREVMDLPLDRFAHLGRTIRLAEHIEGLRLERAVAKLTHAIYSQNAAKLPPLRRWLARQGLLEEPEDIFLGPLFDGDEGQKPEEPEEPEPRRGEGVSGWGERETIADLMAYKRRKEREGR